MKNLQNIATIGILLALLWIGYELHQLNSGIFVDASIGGSISTDVNGKVRIQE